MAKEDLTPGAVNDSKRALDDQIKAWHEAFSDRSIASLNAVVYRQRHALGIAKLRVEAAAKNTTVAALTEQRYAENAQYEDELRRAAEEEYAKRRRGYGRGGQYLRALCKEPGCPRFANLPHSQCRRCMPRCIAPILSTSGTSQQCSFAGILVDPSTGCHLE